MILHLSFLKVVLCCLITVKVMGSICNRVTGQTTGFKLIFLFTNRTPYQKVKKANRVNLNKSTARASFLRGCGFGLRVKEHINHWGWGSIWSLLSTSGVTHISASQKALRGGSWSFSSPILPGLVSGSTVIFTAAATVQHVMSNMPPQNSGQLSSCNHLLDWLREGGKSFFLSCRCPAILGF